MNLGEIIERLESVPRETVIKRSFDNPHSWRGVYAELAVEPCTGERTVGELVDILKPCVGKTFEGYKGGDFTMSEYSEVHLSYKGSSHDYLWDWLLDFMLGEV